MNFPILNLHTGIAKDVWPNGAKMRCELCGRSFDVTVEDCGAYLRNGWPRCCGRTMTTEKI